MSVISTDVSRTNATPELHSHDGRTSTSIISGRTSSAVGRGALL
ncbi:hypothetical protein BZL29_0840 [Mycobacterium kansasii]|uniref:Uncharacterized protein n=1 Tax=Mycobacterium kansasii TaxID=1768 RepID=A0A1V3XYL7_MYCKA|nr:hypothetical protein BZL29_0840 [Mycobacterium kansasii]